jgi:Zn-dependent protease with chaperone function
MLKDIALICMLATAATLILILATSPYAQSSDSSRAIDTTVVDTSAATGSTDVEIPDEADESIYPMSEERKAKLASYSRFNHIWRFVNLFIGLGILALILFTGLSARLRNWAKKAKKKFLVVWLFMILLLVVDYLLNFPFSVYRNFVVESNYGFMNQTFWEWLGQDLLGLGLSAIIGIIPMWFLYQVISKYRKWWLVFAIGAIPFVIFFIVIAPVFISPLFNDFVPLQDQQLKTEILDLASRAGIEGSEVFQVDASRQSTKLNAYVTGLFGTKRIVLYDTMINSFTLDEIKFVMAHEMGHYVMHHVWYGVAMIIVFMALALWITSRTITVVIRRFQRRFGFERLGDIASLPLIMMYVTVLMFLFNPAINSISRYMEHQADTYGMNISGVSGESAAVAFDKLAVYNLSDPDPPAIIEFWFYSHPALKKRMEFVRSYVPN